MKLIACVAVLLCLAGVLGWLWTPDKDQATLERLYAGGGDDSYVTLLGATIHLRISGPVDGPAIMLVHGFGSSLQTWDAWARTLEQTCRVVRLDLPGNGLSPPDPTHDYTDARSVALLAALQDHLGWTRSSLVGHSIGGRIAWRFAADLPERVDKLILVAPDGFSSPGFDYGQAPKIPAVMNLMRFVLPKFLLRKNLLAAYADPAVLTDAVTTRYHDLLLAPGAREAMLERMRQTVLSDPVPELKKIHAPTLLIWGRQDAMIPYSNSVDYLKAIPGARRVTVEQAGHLPQEENPEIALDALLAFMRQPSNQEGTVR